jgi:signal transduction histidine kinase
LRTFPRSLSVSHSRSNGWWLTLLLLLVVLVPSGGLLWFMNQAMRNERLAVRQKLVEAYRGHLTLAQERLESYWKQHAADLDAQVEQLLAPALFAKQVRAGAADAVICFELTGKVVYPGDLWVSQREQLGAAWAEVQYVESKDLAAAANAYAALAGQMTNLNLAALALQAQARCLAQAGRKEAALSVLTGSLAEERYRNASDLQGRMIVPNAELMAIELLQASAPERVSVLIESLRAKLNDYHGCPMAAPQRRFLMHRIEALFPDEKAFPTLAAEDLAARYLEAGESRLREPGLRLSSLSGIWQLPSTDGRTVSLHRTENLALRNGIVASRNLPPDVRVNLVPPGHSADEYFLSVPAGAMLPGWRLALALRDQGFFETTTRERMRSYLWIGALAVATVLVLALLALGLLRHQLALNQLRNDLVANVTHELKTPLSSMRLLVETLLNSPQFNEWTVREYLQLIARENVRLSRLIDNFLTFSRIERNKYTFEFKEVSPTVLVETAAATVRERFTAPSCQFEVRIASNLPPVLADGDAMVTVLLNLLDNAYKYSGEAKQILFTAEARNGSVVLAVKDNGIGLSARDTNRVFKRFYQVNEHLSRSSGGCGLGLSIVQFVVNAHGGTVRVESQPGHGSTFIVTIPNSGTASPRERAAL